MTFPSARQIKNMGVENLVSIIGNERKSEYLITVAEAFDRVDENFLRKGNIKEVKEWLLNVRGIGEWSAHLELIRGLEEWKNFQSMTRLFSIALKSFTVMKLLKSSLSKLSIVMGNLKVIGLIISGLPVE